MDTEMKHISLEKRKLSEVEEIAEREGRKSTDILREAVANYLRQRETDSKVHTTAPGESVVRPGDKVVDLEFREMWIPQEDRPPHQATHGDKVKALEIGDEYHTYYRFGYIEQYYHCEMVAPISNSLLDEITTRVSKYQV